MENSNGNQPAYPFTTDAEKDTELYSGLTKRELIAAMAMQGLLAGDVKKYEVNDDVLHGFLVAKDAIHCADALLNKLNNS